MTTDILGRPNVMGRPWVVAFTNPATRGHALRAKVAAWHQTYRWTLPPVLSLGQIAIQKEGLRLLAQVVIQDIRSRTQGWA